MQKPRKHTHQHEPPQLYTRLPSVLEDVTGISADLLQRGWHHFERTIKTSSMVAADWPLWLLVVLIASMTDAFSHVSTSLARRRSLKSCKRAVPNENDVVDKERSFSDAAAWHRERRRLMLERYGSQLAPLERNACSQQVALPLLVATNLSLLALSITSGFLPAPFVVMLAAFPGSVLSLWQLQILHDALHGSMLNKGRNTIWGIPKKHLQDRILFWGSMPSVFGYYLYLKYGHLSHHKNVGDPNQANLATLFHSDQADFEDGDVLFVAHRMKLKGDDVGPRFHLFGRELKMSISKSAFNAWRKGNATWNAAMFVSSFLFERFMLVINDAIVALAGRNYFFPNKPQSFHKECTKYARWATLIRGALWAIVGWKSLLFLYLSETLWSLPPHPACAMFVTNHGSSFTSQNDDANSSSSCIPTSSTYAGRWYSVFTLGTNYHCEHHDFPTIPLTKLGQVRKIAPEFYPLESNDNLLVILKKTFAYPDFYACMDTATGIHP